MFLLWADVPPTPRVPGTSLDMPQPTQAMVIGLVVSAVVVAVGLVWARWNRRPTWPVLVLAAVLAALSYFAGVYSSWSYESATKNYRGPGPLRPWTGEPSGSASGRSVPPTATARPTGPDVTRPAP